MTCKNHILITFGSLISVVGFLILGDLLLHQTNYALAMLGGFCIVASMLSVVFAVSGIVLLWEDIKKKKANV
jgi:uncharacterized iron-regulated membrane protein